MRELTPAPGQSGQRTASAVPITCSDFGFTLRSPDNELAEVTSSTANVNGTELNPHQDKCQRRSRRVPERDGVNCTGSDGDSHHGRMGGMGVLRRCSEELPWSRCADGNPSDPRAIRGSSRSDTQPVAVTAKTTKLLIEIRPRARNAAPREPPNVPNDRTHKPRRPANVKTHTGLPAGDVAASPGLNLAACRALLVLQ